MTLVACQTEPGVIAGAQMPPPPTAELMNDPTKISDLPAQISTKVERLYLPSISGQLSKESGSLLLNSTLAATSTQTNIFKICSPLQSIPLDELGEVISAPYEPPPPGKDERHQGVDFAYYRKGGRVSILGDGVRAIFPGKVAGVIYDRFPYGNMVIIETVLIPLLPEITSIIGLQAGQSLYMLYAHMENAPSVLVGEEIKLCQLLGAVGKSGNAGSAHLHLEARIGPSGSHFSSMANYIESASIEERSNYRLWRTSGVYRHIDPMILFEYFYENQPLAIATQPIPTQSPPSY